MVSDFFYKLDQLYDLDPTAFDYFALRLMKRGDAKNPLNKSGEMWDSKDDPAGAC